MAETKNVYNATTTAGGNPKKWFIVPSEYLDTTRFGVKIAEVILSFVAFVLEETVTVCYACEALYFFEFISCTAFLFTILLLVLLSSFLHKKVGIDSWGIVDLVYTAVVFVTFLIASAVFLSHNSGTNLETGAGVVGVIASIAFFLDMAIFVKKYGFPFLKKKGDGAQARPAEAQMLNAA
ncbi:CKLF-like MARVEL transmembrane domain-containing protein 6 [Denticeps clupeoides]|uniref:MARVEL domain-containing protein n=1 Tax=Denticeps clupeoides TaxID=299321 RepID=A0AAY4AB99_9TELE|nr:CKLF-like MARVEL transmembrane domain-containing protein 4 [Denticeps clupeoides]